ncbi:hypothetical protein DH2020_041640 [Rehmannia glutinosa]|uniref:E3 ubiquitin-protein ligase RMA n=1 Tax=Rehmannia glutinosa TaxID=99300 RepID=A0ABR0UQZ7_REHGL
MAEGNPSTMNLDLNLGPLHNSSDGGYPTSGSYSNVARNLEDWLDGPPHRVGRRGHTLQSMWSRIPVPREIQNPERELICGNAEQIGEGSLATEERPNKRAKMRENGNAYPEDESLIKDDAGKNNVEEGSFFDCNICLDLAKEPIVTCCGHLFCWPCIYRWLNHHSDVKECPVCKGEVTVKNVTPIYGRGINIRERNTDCSPNIPPRPHARRVESWRQAIQRASFSMPIEDMIRRLGGTFEESRELAQLQSQNYERSNLLLNQIITSRRVREEMADLTDSSPVNDEMRDNHTRGYPSSYYRRSRYVGSDTLSSPASAINSTESLVAERLVESFFHSNPVERSQELPLPFDDRDSMSSIAAAIHSESQTVDNAVEIDSTVALSTSSRRRNDASRISDVDSGDSRVTRRRRLN